MSVLTLHVAGHQAGPRRPSRSGRLAAAIAGLGLLIVLAPSLVPGLTPPM